MREYRRKVDRSRFRLVRDANGRLKASTDDEIGDIWAEQKRIRLAEAIAEDKRRAEQKQRRKEKLERLFKRRQKNPTASANKSDAPKELILNIGLPKISLPKLFRARLPKLQRKHLIVSAAVLAVVVGAVGYGLLRGGGRPSDKDVLQQSAVKESPNYKTVLPGKSIEELGGWARVSPPEKDPVYAYIDTVSGVQLNVSQQPLPADFRTNTRQKVEDLAKSFTANETLTAGDLTAYIGTSIKGPQSVVFVKDDLLILIKSSGKLTSEQWSAYITSLR